MHENHVTKQDFVKNRCRTINWALGCPQILKCSDQHAKIEELRRRGIISGCIASCEKQHPSIYNEGFVPRDLCQKRQCQGVNPMPVIKALQQSLWNILSENKIDFTKPSNEVQILATIFAENQPFYTDERQLLYGSNGEIFQ